MCAAWFFHNTWKERAKKDVRRAHAAYFSSLDAEATPVSGKLSPATPSSPARSQPAASENESVPRSQIVCLIGGHFDGSGHRLQSRCVAEAEVMRTGMPSYGKSAFSRPFPQMTMASAYSELGPVGLPSLPVCTSSSSRTPTPTAKLVPFAYLDHRGEKMWGHKLPSTRSGTPVGTGSSSASTRVSQMGSPLSCAARSVSPRREAASPVRERADELRPSPPDAHHEACPRDAATPETVVVVAPRGPLGIGFDDSQVLLTVLPTSPLRDALNVGFRLVRVNGAAVEGLPSRRLMEMLVQLREGERVLEFVRAPPPAECTAREATAQAAAKTGMQGFPQSWRPWRAQFSPRG